MKSITSSWEDLAALPVSVEEAWLEPLELTTGSGWARRSTVIHVRGAGAAGRGEDITYSGEEQRAFQALEVEARLREADLFDGTRTLADWCEAAAELDWFPSEPEQPVSRRYRRWAFESAALDLALRQNRVVLAELFDRRPEPMRFAVSASMGTPASVAPLRALIDRFPAIRFKLDWSPDWNAALLADLAALDRVDVVDLKGLYTGTFAGPAPNPNAYAAVAEALPSTWLEDPAWNAETAAVLAPHQARVTWDVPLHERADFDALPFAPRCVNLKPSRFGSLRDVFEVYAHCEEQGIKAYGGGQFELGPGRLQAQHLASLFHPDGSNDLSPIAYHVGLPSVDTPQAQLPTPPALPGLAPATET